MRHVTRLQVVALFALIGFFVSFYLWLYKIGVAGELKCGSEACETVQLSPWAVQLGVPVAFYGVGGYAVLLAVALVGLQPRWLGRRGPTLLLAGLATTGFAFTLWLTYLELFVIHAICRWCVTSAVIMTLIWVVALHALRATRHAPPVSSPAPRTDP